jgi:hypothetical protein
VSPALGFHSQGKRYLSAQPGQDRFRAATAQGKPTNRDLPLFLYKNTHIRAWCISTSAFQTPAKSRQNPIRAGWRNLARSNSPFIRSRRGSHARLLEIDTSGLALLCIIHRHIKSNAPVCSFNNTTAAAAALTHSIKAPLPFIHYSLQPQWSGA